MIQKRCSSSSLHPPNITSNPPNPSYMALPRSITKGYPIQVPHKDIPSTIVIKGISSMNNINYSYLEPPSSAKKIRFPKNYVYENIMGRHKRRIFARTPYVKQEKEKLDITKQYLSKKAPHMNYSDELLLRLCYSGHFLLSEITEKFKMYDEWHENQLITCLQKPARAILEHGHLYAYGRDYQYCPNVIIRAAEINLEKYTPEDYFCAAANLLEPLEQFMLVGGVIEKWNLIIDFEDKKIPFANYELLAQSMTRISAAYPYRLKRLLMVNSSTKQDAIKTSLINFLERTESQAKIMVIGGWSQLGKWIPEDEREKRYGGILTNLCEFWPIHTTNKYEESLSRVESEDDYKSCVNDEDYFKPEQTTSCQCGEGKCQIY